MSNNKKHNIRHLEGLSSLVAMQLKDKLNLSFVADKKGALTKVLIRVILFAVVTLAIYLILSLLNLLSVFIVISNNLPVPMFNTIFILMITLSTLSCIGSLTKSLYFSRDNLTLLSYPVKASTVFLSKLIVFYILSLIREVTFILPLFLAYGFACKFPIYYFFWALFMFFVICAVPVAIAGVVSIPWMVISMYFRKRPLLQDITTAVLLLGGCITLFFLIDMIPEDMHFVTKWNELYLPSIYNFSRRVQTIFYPFYALSACVIGCDLSTRHGTDVGVFTPQTGIIFAVVAVCIAILVFLSNIFAKPLFFKMSAKPFEYNSLLFSHEYRSNAKRGNYEQYCFAVKKNKNTTSSFVIKELKTTLDNINFLEKGIRKGSNQEKILKIIKGHTKLDFEVVTLEQFYKKSMRGFVIENRIDKQYLVAADAYSTGRMDCYDPCHMKNDNHHKSSFFSLMWKDILVNIRTPGTLVKYFMMISVSPLAIALMNKLFRSINTSFMGNQFVVMFNVLMMVMIPLVSNVSVASIYSREGESSYLIKASPSNYVYTLTAKLVLRWVMVFFSMLATTIVYAHYCDVFFNRPWLLFLCVMLLYTGHLIWSAELDFMNPQDQLYKEVGEGNISNPNENLTGALAFIISFAFTGISLFLMFEDSITVFYKLLVISIIFFVSRVILAYFRVKGYTTSRSERGRP